MTWFYVNHVLCFNIDTKRFYMGLIGVTGERLDIGDKENLHEGSCAKEQDHNLNPAGSQRAVVLLSYNPTA